MVEYGSFLNTNGDRRGMHVAKKHGVNTQINAPKIIDARRKEAKKWLDGSKCPRVLIDAREQSRPSNDKRYKDRINFLTNKLEFYGFEYDIKKLEIGDYVCRNTVIEYKLAPDFVASITDKRLERESINQANSFRYHYVFVVGDLRQAVDNIAAITGNYKRYDLPLIWSNIAKLEQFTRVMIFPNDEWAYNCTLYLFKYNNREPTDLVAPVSKFSDNAAYNYLRLMNGVGGHRASNIVNTLEVESLHDLLDLSYNELISVHGVGSTIAKQILKQIGWELDTKNRRLHIRKKKKVEKRHHTRTDEWYKGDL